MDEQQLMREYQQSCMFHVNPPSFETWKKWREEKTYNADALKFAREVGTNLSKELKVE